MSWRSAERAHTSYFNLKGLQNVWAREPWLSVEYLPPRQNAGLTLCSRSFVKRLKNEIAVKSLKCEQKAADSVIARMLLRNRAELRSCITPPTTQCGRVPLPELSPCTPEWVEQVAVLVTEGCFTLLSQSTRRVTIFPQPLPTHLER